MEMSRSILRAIALDADGEDFERKSTPTSGMADLLRKVDEQLIAATDIPHTLLLGESPSGLGATGESEHRDFFSRIAHKQSGQLRTNLTTLVRYILSTSPDCIY